MSEGERLRAEMKAAREAATRGLIALDKDWAKRLGLPPIASPRMINAVREPNRKVGPMGK